MSDISNVVNGLSTMGKVHSVWGWRYCLYSILLTFSFLAVLLFVLVLAIAINKNAAIQVDLIYASIALIFMVLTRFFWLKLKVIGADVLAKQEHEKEMEANRMHEEEEKAKAEHLRVESLPTDERLVAENEAREAAILSRVEAFNKIRNKLILICLISTVAIVAKAWSMPDILFLRVFVFLLWLGMMSFFGWFYHLKLKEHKEYLEYKRLNG